MFSKKIVAGIVALLFLGISANAVSAQCGNYFKTKYSAINKAAKNSVFPYRAEFYSNDWNGDGKSDLWSFTRDSSGGPYKIVIYPAKPTGYWDWDNPIIYQAPTPGGTGEFLVLDMNADGRKDLIYKYYNGFQVHRNDGNGSLTTLPSITEFNITRDLGFIDVNGDNLLDWVYGYHVNSPELRYQLQTSSGTFTNTTIILTATAANELNTDYMGIGDFTGDGKIDIIYSTATFSSSNKHAVVKNLGDGTFQLGPLVASDLFASRSNRDYNNDGRDDILNQNAIFYGQADGTFIRTAFAGMGGSFFPAELNGDGHLDVLQVSDTFYVTSINNGSGGFSSNVYQGHPAANVSSQQIRYVEDISGDGKADLYTTSIYFRNVFFEPLIIVKENICQPFGETKLADFDGNLNPDLVMWNPASGNWSSKHGDTTYTQDPNTRVFNWGLGSLGDVPALGDFDGDGKTDYTVFRNGTWCIFRSSDGSWMILPFGSAGDIPVPNDYDGGGKTDLAVFRPSAGDWYIWSMETQQFSGFHFGASGDKPVPADYDGDGKTDIAVYRPSDGVWHLVNSSSQSYAAVQWGLAADKPLPADYDGDGRADVTIYRDGTWWMRRSSNNSVAALQWGAAGDIPMPVYRNSQSADFTFYRPSTKKWHSFFYQNNPTTLGGNQDVPVMFGLPNN